MPEQLSERLKKDTTRYIQPDFYFIKYLEGIWPPHSFAHTVSYLEENEL